MTPKDYLQAKMLGWLRPRPEPSVRMTLEERQTLDALNAELPRDFWLRYNALQEKTHEATFTTHERDELEVMLSKTGEWNERRIHLFIVMAKRRGMGWSDLMRQLHISHHPDATAGQAED